MKTTAALLLLLSIPAVVSAADPAKAADPDKKEWVSLVGCMDKKAKNYKSYFEKDDPASCRYK